MFGVDLNTEIHRIITILRFVLLCMYENVLKVVDLQFIISGALGFFRS